MKKILIGRLLKNGYKELPKKSTKKNFQKKFIEKKTCILSKIGKSKIIFQKSLIKKE